MEGNIANARTETAKAQWTKLHEILSSLAHIEFIEPSDQVPDLVFTANAGLVYRKMFILSNFFHKERSPEEPLFLEWFKNNQFDCKVLPQEVSFEGAGDALFDRKRKILWAGYGFRTSIDAHSLLREHIPHEIISLKLIDERFYHLDTCFCPLTDGFLLYYPHAFSEDSLKIIKENLDKSKLIEVSEQDALAFACNAVNIERQVIMNEVSRELKDNLFNLGFTPHTTPLSEFLKAGGAAKCLTIRLDELE